MARMNDALHKFFPFFQSGRWGVTEADFIDDETVDLGTEATQRLLDKDPSGAFLAVVKKDFLKAKKTGKGGGKKGDKE